MDGREIFYWAIGVGALIIAVCYSIQHWRKRNWASRLGEAQSDGSYQVLERVGETSAWKNGWLWSVGLLLLGAWWLFAAASYQSCEEIAWDQAMDRSVINLERRENAGADESFRSDFEYFLIECLEARRSADDPWPR